LHITKGLLALIIPLCLASTIIVAYGAFTISSPVVTVTVNYILALPQPGVSGSVVTLTATLTLNGAPISGGLVSFWHCTTTGDHSAAPNSTSLATIATNGSGVAVWNQAETGPGVYHYIAHYVAA